jgi:hypothetical protein
MQALCKEGLALAEALPQGTLRRQAQFESYVVAVSGTNQTILRVQQVVARLKLGGSGVAAPPGQLGIAPGAAPGWGIGRFGAVSLGDRGTTKGSRRRRRNPNPPPPTPAALPQPCSRLP